MKNPAIFFGAIAVAVISLALGIYYSLPGIHHVATFGSHPADQSPTGQRSPRTPQVPSVEIVPVQPSILAVTSCCSFPKCFSKLLSPSFYF